jgi:hypothetical protein
MASGNPLLAKDIYEKLDAEWYYRWLTWKSEHVKAKAPDFIVGTYQQDK